MNDISYIISPLSVTGKDSFAEASAAELRVLLALIECGGKISSEDQLASLAKTSKTRAVSALALWEGEGVIRRAPVSDFGDTTPDDVSQNRDAEYENIENEYPERFIPGRKEIAPSVEVAKTLRDPIFKSIIEECERLMEVAALSPEDAKHIHHLYAEMGLSSEYIAILAAYIKDTDKHGKLTALKLYRKASQLVERGYDTAEDLDRYIRGIEGFSHEKWEILHRVGLAKAPSNSVKALVNKWVDEYGFGSDIVSLSYDIAQMNSVKTPLKYMDKILEAWHSGGCKNLDDCIKKNEELSAEYEKKNSPQQRRGGKKTEPPTPKFGNFDANEAFLAALDRSFAEKG